MLTSGPEAPSEGGLCPEGKGRPTGPEKDGQMDKEVHRLPQRNPQRVPSPLPLAKGKEEARSQETAGRRGDGERRRRGEVY